MMSEERYEINKKVKRIVFPEYDILSSDYDYTSDWPHIDSGVFVIFESGEVLVFTHINDCCEIVSLKEVGGTFDKNDDFNGLILKEVVLKKVEYDVISDCGDDRQTTIYELMFDKGFMQLMFVGESNGYYSISVDVFLIDVKNNEYKELF